MRKNKMLIVKKRRKICVPNSLPINVSWHIIAPVVAKVIGVTDYTPIPFYFDTNAYNLGHIFVPIGTKLRIFGAVPVLKVLGPIRNFVVEAETNFKWLEKDFYRVRKTGDFMNFRIILHNKRKFLSFTGYNYHILTKPYDMPAPENVTINRAAHIDLHETKWIGLITSVVVTKIYEINIIKHLRERRMYVGDKTHTIFFQYEICDVDVNGTITHSSVKKKRFIWSPITDKYKDKLPLNKFNNY